VHPFAQRLLNHVRQQELLKAGDRVGVAVSGGIDSVALLRLLLELRGELGIVLSVVHFNHKLRGAESDGDEAFVAGLARAHDLELYIDSDDVAGHAKDEGVSLETAARALRYGFFRFLIEGGPQGLKPHVPQGTTLRGAEAPLFHGSLNKIVTGHTLDDQAETVLMRVIRGAGMRGLGGIHPRIPVEDDDGEICGEIVRPVLGVRRRELKQYLRDISQSWREDATNEDARFTRNRVRKLLVPLLEREFNPAVAENLSELAEIARGEEDYWENEVAGWMGTGVQWLEPEWSRASSSLVQINPASGAPQGLKPASNERPLRGSKAPLFHGAFLREAEYEDLRSRIESVPWLVMNASVDRLWIVGEPVAVQRRVIKAIGEHAGIPLEFKHVEEILRFAVGEIASGKGLSLPLGWKVVREPDELLFLTPDLREPDETRDYEYELPVPGAVVVSEAGSSIEVRCVAAGDEGYNPEQLLNAESLRGPLKVRNWRAGDRFWPAHTKSPKKIKELLQERHIAQPERRHWPVVLCGDEIVWVRGFGLPARLQAKPGCGGVLISERALGAE